MLTQYMAVKKNGKVIHGDMLGFERTGKPMLADSIAVFLVKLGAPEPEATEIRSVGYLAGASLRDLSPRGSSAHIQSLLIPQSVPFYLHCPKPQSAARCLLRGGVRFGLLCQRASGARTRDCDSAPAQRLSAFGLRRLGRLPEHTFRTDEQR